MNYIASPHTLHKIDNNNNVIIAHNLINNKQSSHSYVDPITFYSDNDLLALPTSYTNKHKHKTRKIYNNKQLREINIINSNSNNITNSPMKTFKIKQLNDD